MPIAHLGLGTNLGDRVANLRAALDGLTALGAVTARSSVWETAPLYVTDQPAFLNMAATLATDLAPRALLAALKELEDRLGRVASVRYGPRLIDLDILLYDEVVMEDEILGLPHPRLHERHFALVPLAEVAGQCRHPVLDATIATLLARLPAADDIRPLGMLGELPL